MIDDCLFQQRNEFEQSRLTVVGDGWFPVNLSNEAYKVATNFLMSCTG